MDGVAVLLGALHERVQLVSAMHRGAVLSEDYRLAHRAHFVGPVTEFVRMYRDTP